jgi:hypothetical protein
MEREFADLHSFDAIEGELAHRFDRLELTRIPYLFQYHLADALEEFESELIDDRQSRRQVCATSAAHGGRGGPSRRLVSHASPR